MDDSAFGRVPRAAARSPTRKRVPGRYALEGELVLIQGESFALVGIKKVSEAEGCEKRYCADEKIEVVEAGESYYRCSKHGPQGHTRKS